jgi:hypothetical protein
VKRFAVGAALFFMFFQSFAASVFSLILVRTEALRLCKSVRGCCCDKFGPLMRFGRTICHPRDVNSKQCERRGQFMLGEQIGETKGKRLVRRMLSVNPPTAEVSFEDSGHMLGVATTGIGSYTSIVGADGTIHGDGQGLNMTEDGEAITWTGTGVGKFGPGGSVSYRGMLFFRTASQKLARLNGACGAFEYEVDAAGSTTSKVWEWK